MNIEEMLGKMTLEDKISLCTGDDFWHTELFLKEGEAIAREAADAGASVVLGPGCNIKRNPLGGRNIRKVVCLCADSLI